MKFAELIALLPCHSFEDFPIHNEGEEAEGLLAAWTGMWHPLFLLAAGNIPIFCRADSPPDKLKDRLLVIPSASAQELPVGFIARAKEEGACVVRKFVKRPEMIAAALAELDGADAASSLDPELVADFLALGYCHLQTELLTRRMRYMSVLDASHFQTLVLAGAEAVLKHDAETAKEKLARCFSLLAEARAHFYPVDAYLIDLTLVAPTTLGESFRKELNDATTCNLMISGETVELLARQTPVSNACLKAALESGRVNLIGGDFSDADLPLLPLENLHFDLEKGLKTYQTHLDRRPEVYGRRKYGLSTALPGVLRKFGFIGAFHFALDDGKFPESDRSKTHWEGTDSESIDAIARVPFDANNVATFLSLSDKMGRTMDADHVATLVFAHWPGQASEYYGDLRRMAKYAPAIGRFINVNEYFHTTDTAGVMNRFEPDEYRVPYLAQAIVRRKADPLSTFVRAYQEQSLAESTAAVRTLSQLLKGLTAPASDSNSAAESDLKSQLTKFADALPREKTAARPGILLVNPLLSTRRIGIDVSELAHLPAVDGPVKGAGISTDSKQKHALVELPPLGFAWIESGPADVPAPRKPPPLIAIDNTLANDFMQVKLHATTGGIQSVHDLIHRGNRMSQQLAMRMPGTRRNVDPDDDATYSIMAIDDIATTCASSVLGEIVTKGRLVHPEGRIVAKYQQRYRLWQDSRVLWIDVDLDVSEELRADPWNSYLAARFAWPTEDAELHRSVQHGRFQTTAKRIESPLYVDVQTATTRTSLLMGGLPYHRRIGLRMLDTMLLAKGETRTSFRLGIGIDLPNTLPAALESLLPETQLSQSAAPPAPVRSGWLFRPDVRNVIATQWEARYDGDRVIGFRVRLLETEGIAGRVNLRCFRPLDSARSVDFLGQPQSDLILDGDRLQLDLAAHQWIEIEATWKI